MKSMTGYGEAAAQGRRVKIVVQLRTLNHRHLDIQLRLPREHLALEEEVRKIIRQRLSRGRVEIFVTRSLLKGPTRALELDEELLAQYVTSLRHAKRKFALQGELQLSVFVGLPELFRVRETETREQDERALLLKALAGAVRNLERSRRREGRQLQLDVQSQVRDLKRVVPALVAEARKISLRRIDLRSPAEESAGAGSEPLPGEAPSGPVKGDIHEEVVRLTSHVSVLAELIGAHEPVGKKIDFLLQEIQRELNTVSSKAPELPVVRLVLAGKEGVEKIREQVQNIE
ncbi:MAG: YicC family protein [Deltaproteobacteria bacterium]|nr:YicC family protein [Deltaproteobacteria bacterium]